MIRLAIYLCLTAALAVAAVWLADRPGAVAIDWLGYHAETSVAVMIGAIGVIVCVAIIVWSLLRYIVTAPSRWRRRSAQKRAEKGQLAITKGLLAVGAGDAGAARKFASEAGRLVADQPLTLLLQAQTAQLSGESVGADMAFRTMIARDDTKLLGLHGLYIEAQRRNDPASARAFAEEAAGAATSLSWAGQAAFDYRCADGDWPGALEALERNNQGGLVDQATYRRLRAVLLTARALSLKDRDRGLASELATEAAKLCPGLIPAAALGGRLLAEAGERRKAGRILEAAWRENPHPDIADAYADLVPGASARDRLARMRTLSRLADGHLESRVAVARAALDAHEFAEARATLQPLISAPTRRVANLMARLEEAEQGDVGRAREWMGRAAHAALDPAWTADGLVVESWMPVSPKTGRLDAIQWRVPVAELRLRGPLIEPTPSAPAVPPAHPPLAETAEEPATSEVRTDPAPVVPAKEPPAAAINVTSGPVKAAKEIPADVKIEPEPIAAVKAALASMLNAEAKTAEAKTVEAVKESPTAEIKAAPPLAALARETFASEDEAKTVETIKESPATEIKAAPLTAAAVKETPAVEVETEPETVEAIQESSPVEIKAVPPPVAAAGETFASEDEAEAKMVEAVTESPAAEIRATPQPVAAAEPFPHEIEAAPQPAVEARTADIKAPEAAAAVEEILANEVTAEPEPGPPAPDLAPESAVAETDGEPAAEPAILAAIPDPEEPRPGPDEPEPAPEPALPKPESVPWYLRDAAR